MAWLKRIDDRAAEWPPNGRLIYAAIKWALVALGAFLLVRTYLDHLGLWPIY